MKQIRRTAMVDGEEYQSVVDDVEIEGDIEETDQGIAFDVVLAKEIVQKYRDHGKVYKPADELKTAAEVSGSVYITDGHPPQGVVQKQEQVYGEISADTLRFEEDGAKVVGRAEVFSDKAPEGFTDEIREGERDSVSIGFYTQVDRSSGTWNDTEYDAVQKDILLDHLAVLKPEDEGRCSTENGCGITQNMDQATMPVADRGVEGSSSDGADKSDGDYDIAISQPEDPREIADQISKLGYEVEMRPCNCGDHEGHLQLFSSEEASEDHTYLSEDDESNDKDSGANFMQDIDSIEDIEFDQLKKHSDVQELLDEKNSLEDKVDSLEDEKESLEEDVEDLKDQLEEFKEGEAEDLREELEEDYGFDSEKIEDKSLEELKTMRDTLSEADLERKSTTSINTGQDKSSKSNSTVGTGGSGPHADKYGSEEE